MFKEKSIWEQLRPLIKSNVLLLKENKLPLCRADDVPTPSPQD